MVQLSCSNLLLNILNINEQELIIRLNIYTFATSCLHIVSTFGLTSINRRGSNFSVITPYSVRRMKINVIYIYRVFFPIIVTFIFNLHESSNAFNGASWGGGRLQPSHFFSQKTRTCNLNLHIENKNFGVYIKLKQKYRI